MPFQLFVQPTGGQMTAAAGSAVSDNIQKLLAKREEEKKQESFNDTIISDLHNNNYVPQEALERYLKTKNVDEKSGIVAAGLRNMANSQAQQKLQMEKELQGAQIEHYGAQSALARAQAADVGTEDGQPFLPVTDETGKPVPGKIYVKKTGAIQDVTAAGETPTLDSSGKFFLDRKTNAWKPLPAATMVLPGMGQDQAQPAGAGSTFNVGGGAPAAAAPGARGLTAQDQQALNWARSNPTDPRAAAILKKLGMQ